MQDRFSEEAGINLPLYYGEPVRLHCLGEAYKLQPADLKQQNQEQG